MPETLTALFFAHVLADYVFQTRWMVETKRNPLVLLVHTAIVIATAQLALGQVYAPAILALGAVHFVIDALKTHTFRDTLFAHLADQGAHILTLIAVALYAPDLWTTGLWATQPHVPPALILHGMILSAGAIYAIRAGGFAVGKLMAPFSATFAATNPGANAETGLPEGLPSGGLMIGYLERALIYVLILAGQGASIGFLIAAKSVMRFETASKEQKAAEYVIIGTLASFGWAIAVSLAITQLSAALPPLEIAATSH